MRYVFEEEKSFCNNFLKALKNLPYSYLERVAIAIDINLT